MENNFTSLTIKEKNSKKIDFFYKISFFFFIISFTFFFVNVIILNLSNYLSQATKARNESKPVIYSFNFKTLEEIKFIPKVINEIKIDKEKIYQYYKKKYYSLKENELIKLINEKIFSFIVLNNENNLDLLVNFSDEVFESTLSQLIEDYQKNIKKFDFYYFKVRFGGITEENLNLLGQRDIESFAQEKINYYYRLKTSPDELMSLINNDEQIILLNNKEKASEKIQDYTHETSLFNDPDFYQLLTKIPIGAYSEIYSLKTHNPFSSTEQKYAFIFFYLEKTEGENMPLRLKINEFITKSKIR